LNIEWSIYAAHIADRLSRCGRRESHHVVPEPQRLPVALLQIQNINAAFDCRNQAVLNPQQPQIRLHAASHVRRQSSENGGVERKAAFQIPQGNLSVPVHCDLRGCGTHRTIQYNVRIHVAAQ